MRLFRRTAMVVVALLNGSLSACGGGGGDGPTNPNPNPGGNAQTLGSVVPAVSSLSLNAGISQSLAYTAYDTDNQPIASGLTVTFSSANAAVAEVDGQGQVLALVAGNTTITITAVKGTVTKTASIPLTVSGALPGTADVVASSGDYLFTPKLVAITRGGSVNWSFGTLEHTVTFAVTTGAPTSIPSGYLGTQSRTFNTAGNFTYNCTIHSGMTGQVVVR